MVTTARMPHATKRVRRLFPSSNRRKGRWKLPAISGCFERFDELVEDRQSKPRFRQRPITWDSVNERVGPERGNVFGHVQST